MFNRQGFVSLITLSIIIGVVVVAAIAGGYFITKQRVSQINSFDECAAAGYPIMESYPEQCRTPDGRSFTKALSGPADASFGVASTMQVNGQIKFSDELVVTLAEINDSRCAEGVACIWAGELSPRFVLLGGNVTEVKEMRLGTTTKTSAVQNGYTINLSAATENTATITVTKATANPPPPPAPVACTMEAKLCPDGSAVGRTGPNCEFAACPTDTGTTVNLREGERNGPLLVQRIYPTYITGLVYREYPVATNEGQPITMYIGDQASNGCTETLTLTRIQTGVATFNKQTDYNRPCPICLAEGTLIDTPSGRVVVQDLKIGMDVWTVDLFGKRVAGKILVVSKTPVPSDHKVVHLVLDDGRELYVSPGHPTLDGRIVGALMAGDALNGSRVKTAELVSYNKGFIYDILSSGATGAYFANGILMGSTLDR